RGSERGREAAEVALDARAGSLGFVGQPRAGAVLLEPQLRRVVDPVGDFGELAAGALEILVELVAIDGHRLRLLRVWFRAGQISEDWVLSKWRATRLANQARNRRPPAASSGSPASGNIVGPSVSEPTSASASNTTAWAVSSRAGAGRPGAVLERRSA